MFFSGRHSSGYCRLAGHGVKAALDAEQGNISPRQGHELHSIRLTARPRPTLLPFGSPYKARTAKSRRSVSRVVIGKAGVGPEERPKAVAENPKLWLKELGSAGAAYLTEAARWKRFHVRAKFKTNGGSSVAKTRALPRYGLTQQGAAAHQLSLCAWDVDVLPPLCAQA
jgi:hypothetical protein